MQLLGFRPGIIHWADEWEATQDPLFAEEMHLFHQFSLWPKC